MRRLFVLLVATLLVSGCRVDVDVRLKVLADGSGSITVLVVADADVVQRAPGLAQELKLNDATTQGWTVDGPTSTESGGLSVKLSHDFSTVEQANVLLASLNGAGGPLQRVTLTRTENGSKAITSIVGSLRIDGGLNAFTDPEVLVLLGGATPYAEQIDAAGIAPADAVAVKATIDIGSGAKEYNVSMAGTGIDIADQTTRSSAVQRGVWRIVGNVLFAALVLWVVAAIAFIGFVATKRRQRTRRRLPQR